MKYTEPYVVVGHTNLFHWSGMVPPSHWYITICKFSVVFLRDFFVIIIIILFLEPVFEKLLVFHYLLKLP